MRVATILAALLSLHLLVAGEVANGSPAPDLGSTASLNTPDKAGISLNALRGRVVLVDFWATWCGPCVAAIPHMQELHETYAAKGLVVIGHTDASSQDLPGFIAKHKITYPISVGSEIGGSWGVTGIPHVFLIAPDGKVAWNGHPAELTTAQIEAQLVNVRLAASPAPSFAAPASVAKVAAVEAGIAGGKVGAGVKTLERLAADEKRAEESAAARASLETIATWKAAQDAELEKLSAAGDVFAAAALADGLAASYAGHDAAKAYKERAATLRKDPAHQAGKEFQKLVAVPPDARKDPRFAKMRDAFVAKHKTGFYVEQAKALAP